MQTPTRMEDKLAAEGSGRRGAGQSMHLVLLLVIASALRLYHLGRQSLWIDEGFSLRDATTPFTVAKASKPLYFWFLSLWMHLGTSDWLLRLPAVIFGVACVALIFLIGRMIWGARAGALAGLLGAVSPLQVDHSQEVRMYTLLTLLVLLSVYFLLLYIRSWRSLHVFLCALFAWMAVLTHPMASLMLIPEGLAVLDAYRQQRRSLLPWVVSQALVMIAWAPWLKHVFGFSNYFEQAWTAVLDKPSLGAIPMLWGRFGLGEWDAAYGGSVMHVLLYVYTYGAVLLAGLLVWREREKPETRFVAAWLVLPTLALLVLSTVKTNAWVTRYMIYTSPPLYLLLGAIWAGKRRRIAFLALAVLLAVLPVGKLIRYYQKSTRPDWRGVAAYVTALQKPTDAVGIYRRGNQYVFEHYYHGQAKWAPLGPRDFVKGELTGWNEQKALDLIRCVPPAPRQWLVVSMAPMQAEEAIDAALRRRFKVLNHRKFRSLAPVTVYLFAEKGRG